MSDKKDNVWPEKLRIRDTQLHDDMGGGGQRIYTTAGQGYEKREYIRADALEAKDKRIAELEAEKYVIVSGDSLRQDNEALKADNERLRAVYEAAKAWADDPYACSDFATSIALKKALAAVEGKDDD